MHYQKAIDLQPKSFDAHYHISILYINQGARVLNQKATDRQEAIKNREKGEQLLSTGLDFMKQAHILSPRNKAPLARLIQVCDWLKLEKEQQIYQAKLDLL